MNTDIKTILNKSIKESLDNLKTLKDINNLLKTISNNEIRNCLFELHDKIRSRLEECLNSIGKESYRDDCRGKQNVFNVKLIDGKCETGVKANSKEELYGLYYACGQRIESVEQLTNYDVPKFLCDMTKEIYNIYVEYLKNETKIKEEFDRMMNIKPINDVISSDCVENKNGNIKKDKNPKKSRKTKKNEKKNPKAN